MGGCGDTKLSDEANSMKWKILHSCIHLGGFPKQISIEGTQRNGVKNRIAMQIEFQKKDTIRTKGIAVGFYI